MIPSMNVIAPKANTATETIEPKPANGTPTAIQNTTQTIRDISDIAEIATPLVVMNFNGM